MDSLLKIIINIIKKYGSNGFLLGIIIATLTFVISWVIVYKTAEPGQKISVFWGMYEYTKQYKNAAYNYLTEESKKLSEKDHYIAILEDSLSRFQNELNIKPIAETVYVDRPYSETKAPKSHMISSPNSLNAIRNQPRVSSSLENTSTSRRSILNRFIEHPKAKFLATSKMGESNYLTSISFWITHGPTKISTDIRNYVIVKNGAINQNVRFDQMDEFTIMNENEEYHVAFRMNAKKDNQIGEFNFTGNYSSHEYDKLLSVVDENGINGEMTLNQINWPIYVKH